MCNHNMPSLGTSSNDKRVHFDACWQHLGHNCKAACPQHIDHKRPILVETHENQPQSPSQGPQICLIETYRKYTYQASFTLGVLAYDIIVDSLARVGSGPDGFISTARSGKSCTTKVLSLPCLDSSDWRCGEMYCLCFPRLKHGIWPDGEKTCCTANLYYNF